MDTGDRFDLQDELHKELKIFPRTTRIGGYRHRKALEASHKTEYFEINNRKGNNSLLFKKSVLSHSLLSFCTSLKSFLCQSVNREIPAFFPVTIANRNCQKMSHLGSPADKRCDILTTGILICCCHNANKVLSSIYAIFLLLIIFFFLSFQTLQPQEGLDSENLYAIFLPIHLHYAKPHSKL